MIDDFPVRAAVLSSTVASSSNENCHVTVGDIFGGVATVFVTIILLFLFIKFYK